jgi:citrate synthase
MAKADTKSQTVVSQRPTRFQLTVRDERTGKEYEIPIKDGAIHAIDLRKIKTSESDFGLMSYDPAFLNTASCRSAVTYIDGDAGILRYRGYPIEELAEKRTYLEVSYLLINGELPTKGEYDAWVSGISHHTEVNERLRGFIDGFHYNAHPMGIFVSTVAALSTFYPDAKDIFDEKSRQLQIHRLLGKVPTIAAFAYRHSMGTDYIPPSGDLSYVDNFLAMMYRPSLTTSYTPNPTLTKALDTVFILHADHEQNCSTNVMRSIGSSHSDPYVSAAGAAAALYGPLHGGANEEVVKMLREIGAKEKIPELIRQVKDGKRLLMGFGHRVYKNYDPRARIVKRIADDVLSVTGRSDLLDIAIELERVALSDDYFIKRHLYPNVDFYSGIIYQAMGFPSEAFPVLFAIARMSGWLAQWREMLLDPELKIARPRQLYTGQATRSVPPRDEYMLTGD